MNASDLYDLTPLARLMLMGVVLALGPLAWVWLRNRQAPVARRLQALTVLTLFLTFDLVLFGAFTRLTDSGLGCPDWPGCYGHASPIGARHDIADAQAVMPTGPVTHGKAWIEMIHRYLATGVGVLILVLAAVSWLEHRRSGATSKVHPGWPLLTLVWVCLQGAFGALTVTMKLFPAIVTLHLLGGMGLLALLCTQAVRYGQTQQHMLTAQVSPVMLGSVSGLSRLAWCVAGLLVLQIALGGWVSTNYAVLACNEFPTCQGSWWPEMNFEQGFELWRALGQTSQGEHVSFAALTAIHYAHRLMAYLLLLALAWLAWCLGREVSAQTHRLNQSRALWVLLALQFGTGLSNVILDWPLLAAVLHTGGAAGLVVVLTWVLATLPARQRAAATSEPMVERTA